MIKYLLHTQDVLSSEIESHESYGISVFSDDLHICTIHDITDNKSDIILLIKKINNFKLDPCHLSQVVEDYLYDLSVD